METRNTVKKRYLTSVLAAILTVGLLGGPLAYHADARPGQGGSMGSRGSRTWSAPPSTRTSPYATAPMERSITPRNPGYASQNPFSSNAAPYQSMRPRHPFMTGLFGGFLGAGLFGLISGHGFFGGIHSMFSMFGLIIQLMIGIWIVRWLWRKLAGSVNGKPFNGFTPAASGGFSPASAPPPQSASLTIINSDYEAFQRILLDIQQAWNQQNIVAMQQMATPEMVSYFNQQLSALASQGARNVVSDVRFIQGDLSEAWRENGMDYATVAMRYSLIDLTTNAMGQVIEGSSTEPVTITEVWTFTRPSRGGSWLLSAIQQTGQR